MNCVMCEELGELVAHLRAKLDMKSTECDQRVRNAIEVTYNDCLAVAEDFSGQGVAIAHAIRDHKRRALL